MVEVRWGGDFAKVVVHAERIAAVRKFKPRLVDGQLVPRRVFVNSMSDLMHEAICDSFRDLCFDAIEQHDVAVFQVLTKRPMTMRCYIERRYGNGPRRSVPERKRSERRYLMGWPMIVGEKGGATLDGAVLHEMPAAFEETPFARPICVLLSAKA